ncbi:MAG: Lin0512 family protein [Burkholderiales bacterium]
MGSEGSPANVLLVEIGMGLDQHGQDITKAAVRACQNAIRNNTLPGLKRLLPGGDTAHMRVHVHLAVPIDAEKLDRDAVRAVFPYGRVTVAVTQGGMLAHSHSVLADKGDRNDLVYVVIASVEVGW